MDKTGRIMKLGGEIKQRSTGAEFSFGLRIQCILGFSFAQIICIVLGSFFHELPNEEIVSIFMLANSCVGQDSGSIEQYFLIYLKWTVVGSPEEMNRRKEKIGRISQVRSIEGLKHPSYFGCSDRSVALCDRSDGAGFLGKSPKLMRNGFLLRLYLEFYWFSNYKARI